MWFSCISMNTTFCCEVQAMVETSDQVWQMWKYSSRAVHRFILVLYVVESLCSTLSFTKGDVCVAEWHMVSVRKFSVMHDSNSNSIYFKSLKSQWFRGPYMSNRQHTQIQTFKCIQNKKMKKKLLENTHSSKYFKATQWYLSQFTS